MKQEEVLTPTLIDDKYKFTETVNGGYLQRSDYAYYTIESIWNKDFTLFSIKVDNEDYTKCFYDKEEVKRLKNVYHLNRVKRAYNRHLRYLKIYLGLIQTKIIPTKKFIMIGYQYHSKLEFKELPLTKDGKPNMREAGQHTNYIVEETPELRKIAEDYNKRLIEWKKDRDNVMDLLFKKEK